MRDIIQFDETVDDSINRITNAHRTCDLILGVGDGKVYQYNTKEKEEEKSIKALLLTYVTVGILPWIPVLALRRERHR